MREDFFENQNIEKIFDELRARQDYLVVQANDLAKFVWELKSILNIESLIIALVMVTKMMILQAYIK